MAMARTLRVAPDLAVARVTAVSKTRTSPIPIASSDLAVYQQPTQKSRLSIERASTPGEWFVLQRKAGISSSGFGFGRRGCLLSFQGGRLRLQVLDQRGHVYFVQSKVGHANLVVFPEQSRSDGVFLF